MNAPAVLTTVTKTHNVPTPMGLLLVTAMQGSQETAGSAQVSYPEIQLSSFLLFLCFEIITIIIIIIIIITIIVIIINIITL